MSGTDWDDSSGVIVAVLGREGVAGPLQEVVELCVLPQALVLRRGRLLKAIRGGRSEKTLPLADLSRVEFTDGGGAMLVPRAGAGIGPTRTIHGVAALAAVAAWWATMGRSEARLMGSAATFTGPLGIRRSGVAIGGPAGIAFVPTGWVGAIDEHLVRIPLGAIEGFCLEGSSQIYVSGEFSGELRLDGGAEEMADLAAWFAREVAPMDSGPRVGGLVAMNVIWQVGDRAVWRAFVSAADGRLTLASRSGEAASISVPNRSVERVQSLLSGSSPSLVLNVDGRSHTLRPSGSVRKLQLLGRLIRRRDVALGHRSFDRGRWKSLEGEHAVARLFRGASAEGSLRQVRVVVGEDGLMLQGVIRNSERQLGHLGPGSRLRISLSRGRGWQHFGATVKRLDLQGGTGEETEGVELLVLPVVDGPLAEDGRRSFHRVSMAEPTPFPIQRQRLTEQLWQEAHLVDLSAGGFGAVLTESIAVGDQFRVKLPLGEWCAPLEAEVVHCRPVRGSRRTWQVGFRLVGITERHRALVQRAVLRREREQLPNRRGADRMDPTAA